MDDDFEQQVFDLIRSNSDRISLLPVVRSIKRSNVELLPSFVSKFYQTIQNLEQLTWQLISQFDPVLLENDTFIEYFECLSEFNRNLVLKFESIEIHLKGNLLFPREPIWIDEIFGKIKRVDDENNPWIGIVSNWFNNMSLFLRDNPDYDSTDVIRFLAFHLVRDFVMSEQYRTYLNFLNKPKVEESIFTKRMLFYLKSASFFLNSYLSTNNEQFSYESEDIFNHIGSFYTDLIIIHSYSIGSWSDELLSCLTHLIGFVLASCWSNRENRSKMKMFISNDLTALQFIDGLIRIIVHESFYPRTGSQRGNDQTILIDETLMTVNQITQNENFLWIFRSKLSLPTAMLRIAEHSICDKICLCIYTILAEILSDERLKEMKIPHHASRFFFNILEQAWHNPRKKYKQIPITFILRSLLSLSRVDSIQQTSAETNQLPLLIEMCEKYPIVFEIIWAFSFNEDIQDQLRQQSNFMRKLVHPPRTLHDGQLRRAIHGILWNVDIHDNHQQVQENDDESNLFDMMISYSHRDEVFAKTIYNDLKKKGYRVWIDFDQIHGNVMDAMAYAIERSQIVLICMSDHYRRSNYCRAEAHYAFQRQRKLIPIIVQEHFKPDGWLLFLIGQLLFIDFSEDKYQQGMEMLKKELDLTEARKLTKESIAALPDRETHDETFSQSMNLELPVDLQNWNSSQVQTWLNQHQLVQLAKIFQDFDGLALIYIYESMNNLKFEQMINLLHDDAVKRTNQSLSLVELSQFRALMERKHPKRTQFILEMAQSKQKFPVNEETFSCCHIL